MDHCLTIIMSHERNERITKVGFIKQHAFIALSLYGKRPCLPLSVFISYPYQVLSYPHKFCPHSHLM